MADTNEGKETTRIEAFSDGVFAIAITLLVLELKTPRQAEVESSYELFRLLIRQWPSYMAFLFSFVTILVMWINHHRILTLVKRSDTWLMITNGILLLLVTAVPFPTSVLAEHFRCQGAEVATAMYTLFYVLISLAFNAMWLTISWKRRLLRDEVTDTTVHVLGRRMLLGIPAYTSAVVLAFLSPTASLLVCLGLMVHWITMNRGCMPECAQVSR